MAAKPGIGFGVAAAITVTLILASCAPKRPAPPAPPAPPPPAVEPVALDPQSYMAMAGSNALFVVRASGLAQERVSRSALRQFASEAARDHNGIGAQLNFAGRRINLLPSNRLQPRYQTALDQLAASTDFDTAYRRQITVALRDCIRWHRSFEKNGESPTLRPVARFAASVCEANLEGLRRAQ